MLHRLDFSARGKARVLAIVFVGTAVCMVAALFAVSYTTPFMPSEVARVTFALAVVLPLIMSLPICYLFAAKLRELAIAHHELAIIASQDSLTTCLNRGAFVTLVDAYLDQPKSARSTAGALLVIDADHFKTINDRFGHSAGDEALKLIVKAIKSTLRTNDLLGRVGGEEFAVFFPETDPTNAKAIAERICWRVNATEFIPMADRVPLSVSVGGATFRRSVDFTELYTVADKSMYAAKSLGRNRVEFAAA